MRAMPARRVATASADPEGSVQCPTTHFGAFFESGLGGCYTDPEPRLKQRSLKLFRECLGVECHGAMADTVGREIVDDAT